MSLLRRIPVGDPWERLDTRVALAAFGSGARRDFSWYFEGESAVGVGSLEEVQGWLGGCEYASDPHLFQEPDFWQHPRTFEHLRKGDCEDFALWAWRKLVELGYDADFVVGRRAPAGGWGEESRADRSRHAWVVFRREGAAYVYEPTWQAREDAVQPLAAVRERYIPEIGVGPDRRIFAFSGYLLSLRERPRRAAGASLTSPAAERPAFGGHRASARTSS